MLLLKPKPVEDPWKLFKKLHKKMNSKSCLLKSIKSQLSTEDCAVKGSVSSGRTSDVASSISSQSQRPRHAPHSDYNSLLEQAMRLRVPSELNFLSRIPSIRSTVTTPYQDQSPVETPRYSLDGTCPLLTSSREAFTKSQTVLEQKMRKYTGHHHNNPRLPLISSLQPRSKRFSTDEHEHSGS